MKFSEIRRNIELGEKEEKKKRREKEIAEEAARKREP